VSTPPPPPPKPPTDKELIAVLLEKLGVDWKDKDQAEAAVWSITELELVETNFPGTAIA
jgi:hypothetical protein